MPSVKLLGSISLHCSLMAMVLLTACNAPRPARTNPEDRLQSLRFDLPASLERDRGVYENDVATALGDVAGFFRSSGFALPEQSIIDSVTVFESASRARDYFARAYNDPTMTIPETFAGTVENRRLYLVSRESYRTIWQKLYPGWPWTRQTYRQLIIHELAHRAHEEVSIASYGTAEAMGPTWFFEGLAVSCAGQFDSDEPLLSIGELKEQVGAGHTPEVSYPLYGRLVRSLAARYGMKALIAGASMPGFPDILWTRTY